MADSGKIAGRFFTLLIVASFRRRRAIRVVVAVLTLAAAFAFSRASFTNDIAGLFPPASKTAEAYRTIMDSGFSRRITVEIDASGIGGVDASGTADAIETAAEKLTEIPGVISVFCRFVPRELGAALDELGERLPELTAAERISGRDPDAAAAAALKALLQPVPGAGTFMRADPFGLRAEVISGLEGLRSISGFVYSPRHFFPVSEDGSRALLSLEIAPAQSDTTGAGRIFSEIETRLNNTLPSGAGIVIHAPHLHAIANEKMLKRDVNIVVTLSLVLLLALFWIVYRGDVRGFWRPAVPLVASLWMLGLLAACGGALYVFVVGMGGGIIGLAVDQGIHIYSALRGGGRGVRRCGRLAPSLLLGMLTTAAVFLLLTLTRSPALTQLGIFAGGSQLLSWVLNLLLLPPLLSGGGRAVFAVPRCGAARARVVTAVWIFAVVVGAAVFAIRGEYRLDLEQLDGAAGDLAVAQREFEAIWRRGSVPVPLLMVGDEDEEVMRAAEALIGKFPPDTEFFSPTRLWPSRERRERNLASWRDFAASGGLDRLEAKLAGAASSRGLPKNFFAPFFAGIRRGLAAGGGDSPPVMLRPAVDQLVRSTSGGGTALMMLVRDRDGAIAAALNDDGNGGGNGGVRRLLLTGAGFRELLARDFGAVFFMVLGAAALLVAAATALFFRRLRPGLLALVPVATTIAVVGSGLAAARIAFNPILAFAAVILVGLAVDYGIFAVTALREGEGTKIPEAMAMSAATTVCAVGALLFSAHPILFQTGLVLTVGVTVAALTGIFVVPALAASGWWRRRGVLLVMFGLFCVSGCASEKSVPVPEPSREELEAFLVRWRDSQAERYTIQANWVVDHWFFTLPLLTINRVDTRNGTLKMAVMTPTGAKLFEIAPGHEDISPLFPDKYPNFPRTLHDDAVAVYLGNTPELPECYAVIDGELTFSIRQPEGDTVSYRFAGTPPVLKEKCRRGFWRTRWRCVYDEYLWDASGRMVPGRVTIESNHSGVDSRLNAIKIFEEVVVQNE